MRVAETDGGKVYIADSTNFKVSKTIASALVVVEPGAMRELNVLAWPSDAKTVIRPLPEI
jgi:hypothetical protein